MSYLFTRRARLANNSGQLRESQNWAAQVTEKVNQVQPLKTRLFTSVFSPNNGMLAWVATADNLKQLEDTDAKLVVDDSYAQLVNQGAQFLDAGYGIQDQVSQIVHGMIDPESPAMYAQVTEAQIAVGHLVAGTDVGVEIAERVEGITKAPTAFCADITGQYAGVRWISQFTNIGDLQRASEATANDPEFAKFIDKAAPGVFLDAIGAVSSRISRRIV